MTAEKRKSRTDHGGGARIYDRYQYCIYPWGNYLQYYQ